MIITVRSFPCFKTQFTVDITWTVEAAPWYYVPAIVAMSQLLGDTIYWTKSKNMGKYESFPHPNI